MSREPSYYEIALTHRQVVVFFVLALACILASFFLGLWMGRGSDGPTRLADVRTEEEAPAAVDETTPADSPETAGLREMAFFSDEDAGRALRDDADAPARPAATPEPARAATERPVTSPPAPSRTEPAPRSTPPPGTRPTASETSTGADRPRPSRPPSAAGVVIQVFSSDDQGKAQEILDRLLRADYDAHLAPGEIDGRVMYRVRVGPYSDRDLAEEVAKRLERDMGLDTWVTGS